MEGATVEYGMRGTNLDPNITVEEQCVVERYPLESIHAFMLKCLGRTYDYSDICYKDAFEELYFDEKSKCFVYSRPDIPETSGFEAFLRYTGYTAEDDTHYAVYVSYVTFGPYEGLEEPYVRITDSISVTYVNGNYIVTSYKMAWYEKIMEDEFWESL